MFNINGKNFANSYVLNDITFQKDFYINKFCQSFLGQNKKVAKKKKELINSLELV